MGDLERWSVTYTKHIKQKRKVYHDGILETHSSSHKVVLYDDCEKLLDSRFMKKDDVIKSGETITFGVYLVDIGDSHGEHKPVPCLNSQGMEKKTAEKARFLHSQGPRKNSTTVGDRKPKLQSNKALPSNLSPSQKIIRDFKKSRMNNYGTSPTCPEATKPGKSAWQVLYTTQITQKAKKYHDGFLTLAICGSQLRQVMLYDATRRLLDSRFLKKDEAITSGESLTFDGHLVDIGECEEEHKPLEDCTFQGRNRNAGGKTEILHERVQGHNNSPIEWDAMYTAQVTQKHKKYNCGILKLASCGSYQMEVTLLSEDGNILGHKFLKVTAELKTGNMFALPNYLVEIGEPRITHEGRVPLSGQSQKSASWKENDSKIESSSDDDVRLSLRIPRNKQSDDRVARKNGSSAKDTDSNIRSSSLESINLSETIATKKPLRDACAILSIIKNPMTRDHVTTMKGATVEESHASRSSEFFHSDIQNQAQLQKNCYFPSKKSLVEDYDEKTTKMTSCYGEISKSKPVDCDLPYEIINAVGSVDRDKSSKTSTSCSLGSGASSISLPSFEIEGNDSNKENSMPPSEGLGVINASKPDSKRETPNASVLPGGNMDIEDCTGLLSTKATPSFGFGGFRKVKLEDSLQPKPSSCADNTGNMHKGISGFDNMTSSDFTSCDYLNIEKHKNGREMNEFPSFDLGF